MALSLFIYLFSFDSASYYEKENYCINYYFYYYYFVSKPFFSLFLSYILFYGHLSFDFGIQLRLLATYAYGFLYCRKNYVLISPCQRLWMAFSTLPRHILELKLNRLMVWLQYVCQLLQLWFVSFISLNVDEFFNANRNNSLNIWLFFVGVE